MEYISSSRKIFFKYRIDSEGGQTLIEGVIALAVFSFLAAALVSMILGGIQGVGQGSEQIEAETFAQEGIEAVRSIRDGAWNELRYNQSGITAQSGQWTLSGEGSVDIRAPYTRTITFASVCRSLAGDIAACPASYTDAHTLYVVSTVAWKSGSGAQNSIARSAYITNWDSRYWTQTDWSGGSGQNTWLLANHYLSDDGKVDVSTAGQVQIAPDPLSGTWSEVVAPSGADEIRGVSVVSATDAWAAGKEGRIFHYNGTAWSQFTDVGTQDLNGIAMVSSTNGWAVGNSGKIYHYNGINWSEFADTGSSSLFAIAMVSSSLGWAIGGNGEIDKYNGTTWTSVSSPVSQQLNAINIISANDVWVVGDSGKFLHYNGTSWSEVADLGGNNVESVSFLSTSDGFAGGQNGEIYRYNGSTWSLFTDTGNEVWYAISHLEASSGWIMGTGGAIRQWNGSTWSAVSSPTVKDIRAVGFFGLASGWAVGDNLVLQYAATGLNYYTSGSLISSAFSLTDNSPVQVIEWDATIPTCSGTCDVRFQVRTAPDVSGSPGVWTSWYGATGANTYFTQGAGSRIPIEVNGNRWVQYQAFLRGDAVHTPTLQEVRIDYK